MKLEVLPYVVGNEKVANYLFNTVESDKRFSGIEIDRLDPKQFAGAVAFILLYFGFVQIKKYDVVEYHSITRDIDDIKGIITSIEVMDPTIKSLMPKLTADELADGLAALVANR